MISASETSIFSLALVIASSTAILRSSPESIVDTGAEPPFPAESIELGRMVMTAGLEMATFSIALPEKTGLSTLIPSEIDVTSWTTDMPSSAARLAPSSRPRGVDARRTVPPTDPFNALDHDWESKTEKQLPLNFSTLSTPTISEASDSPPPPGMIIVHSPPITEAA